MATYPRASYAEQILLVSHLSFFFYEMLPLPPAGSPQKKFWLAIEGGWKPLFVFCTTERAISMAQNETLLPRRLVMPLEFSTFSRQSDAVSQRLISAIAFWQTACQHLLAPPDCVGPRKIMVSLINERQCKDLPQFILLVFNLCQMRV